MRNITKNQSRTQNLAYYILILLSGKSNYSLFGTRRVQAEMTKSSSRSVPFYVVPKADVEYLVISSLSYSEKKGSNPFIGWCFDYHSYQ